MIWSSGTRGGAFLGRMWGDSEACLNTYSSSPRESSADSLSIEFGRLITYPHTGSSTRSATIQAERHLAIYGIFRFPFREVGRRMASDTSARFLSAWWLE